jgi:hypothetical protein
MSAPMQYRLVTMPSDPAQPNEDVGRPSEFVSDSHEVGLWREFRDPVIRGGG